MSLNARSPLTAAARVASLALVAGLVASGCEEDSGGGTTTSPSLLIVFSGNDQVAPVSTELPDPLVVQLVRAPGGIDDRSIEWTVEQGGGAVTLTQSPTDVDGFASTFLTLGPTDGTNTVRATLEGTSESVVFTAFGVEPVPRRGGRGCLSNGRTVRSPPPRNVRP
jgi:hypothetical protein